VGCRARASKATLLRVVAIRSVLTPDRAHRLPGRGAWVHPDPGCVDLAERRRAFPRALRLPGPLDLTPVRECVAALERSPDVPHGSSTEDSDTSPDESRSIAR
jgi:predicted RNA-binding protein YlxR (DUF448 family)